MRKIIRWLPLVAIIGLMIAAYLMGWGEYLSFEQLKQHRESLKDFVAKHSIAAPIVFILTYMCVTALSLPVAIYLTLLGGFLFPQPFSTLYVVIGATAGACILYFAATTALHDFLKRKVGSRLEKMRAGFQENAVSYLLFLRFVPAFPFWLVNIAPAFFGIPFFTFMWTTAVGITPGAFVYAQIGTGLGAIFESGETFTVSNLLNNQIKIAFLALGLFALAPTVYKWWRKRKKKT